MDGSLRQFADTVWKSLAKPPARSSVVIVFLFVSLIVGALLTTRFIDSSSIVSKTTETSRKHRPKITFPLVWFDSNATQTCPEGYPEKIEFDSDAPPPSTCPDYFRWIYEDLQPWRESGITRDMVESASRTATFRLVILNGKAYVERYKQPYQTRDVFTLWGILQLLRKYPGRVPDLDLMFDCVDWPVISKHHPWPNGTPPPLFRYCGDDKTLDIVFPDWSFWGWAEINIKPWHHLSDEIKEGNKMIKFLERDPHAYWKGNPFVAPIRMDLLKCNVSDEQDWGARIFIQDWIKEGNTGFKESNLANQCKHRYKIYIEGSAWSVSEKYILACDSLSLIVKPNYYDFFSRGLMPMQHYWPIREDEKCRSIKFAVEWGNSHKQKAEAIGKAASDFIHDDVKMDYVYDYMLHLLTEYAKLLKFKPEIPKNAVELCSETMAISAPDNQKKFMMESLVTSPSDTDPCTMPPRFDQTGLLRQLRRKTDAEKQVEEWEKNYWNNQTAAIGRESIVSKTTETSRKHRPKITFPLVWFDSNATQTCPKGYPEKIEFDSDAPPPSTCPDYFRWIYEDLQPWREIGITRDMVESARRTATFRLVILNGKAYVERYKQPYQTRDVFTLWGILQLLRKYPGRVPDLDLMFDCVDWPVISKHHPWPNGTPPPLFRYCGDDKTLDIVFPDWSFWGWAEINIKPWHHLSDEIKEGNKMIKFLERDPHAYWKGNPFVAPIRMDLLKCNVSDEQDWGARIFIQDWIKEGNTGFKESNLANQCKHRYKIYIEGSAWSVSEKYILACDSLSLIVKPKYYDFFSRGLMPMQHYWPIREDEKCRSINFAVEWGNSHKQKAEAIGKAASDFIHDDVKMDYVYDYMLHLLTEYAKLLKFKPEIPKNAVELCSETMAISAADNQKKFMMESLVTSPSDTAPCTMPPRFDQTGLVRQLRRKTDAEKQAEDWEKNYWNNKTMQQ